MGYRTLGLLAAGLLASCAGTCAAQAPGPWHHETSVQQWKQKLGLSKEQSDRLDAALKTEKEAVQPLAEKYRQSMQTLREQLKGKASDQDIQATLAGLDRARTDMRAAMERFWKEASSILTPTQRAKMLEAVTARERMHEGNLAKPDQGAKPAAPAGGK